MATNISLKSLAKLLDLAPSTVSRALRGHPDISPQTRERVEQLAQQLHYAPDAVARSLRNRRSNQIAVIVPEITDYFFSEVLRGVMQHARLHGYNMIVFETQERYEEEVDICRSICKAGIDGVILCPAKTVRDTRHLVELKACNVALVLFDRIGANIEADRVATDNYNGAYQVVKHMLMGGCHRVAYFSTPQHMLTGQKQQHGYIQALGSHKIHIDRDLIVPCDDRETAISATYRLLEKHKVDGIFAADDWIATGVLCALRQMALRVPEDVAVCGYLNTPLALVTTPSLTSVEVQATEMGRMAAGLLQRRITGDGNFITETHLLKATLSIRESSRSILSE